MSNRQETKMEFSASIRMAFRFVKKHVVRPDGPEKPLWQGFDEDDMFTSIVPMPVIRRGRDDDGDELLERAVVFELKGVTVAYVKLEGKRTSWGSTCWAVSYAMWRRYFGADENRDPEWAERYIPVGGCYSGDVYQTS